MVQPAIRYTPSTTWNLEMYYNFLQGDLHGDDNENIIQTLDHADEVGIRFGFQY